MAFKTLNMGRRKSEYSQNQELDDFTNESVNLIHNLSAYFVPTKALNDLKHETVNSEFNKLEFFKGYKFFQKTDIILEVLALSKPEGFEIYDKTVFFEMPPKPLYKSCTETFMSCFCIKREDPKTKTNKV